MLGVWSALPGIRTETEREGVFLDVIYHDFKELKLSALGLGFMRMPVIDKKDDQLDEPACFEMIDYAMAHGINYYDTGWGYHGEMSETVLGKALAKYPRESFVLADKFPGYDLSTMDKVEWIFEEQLKKCQVDYFDLYLLHNVCEMNFDPYMDPKNHIYPYLLEQKEKGRIHHLGFSTHGSLETMKRFLDLCGEGMEFCQIQLNYLDWDFQDAKAKVELLGVWGLPIIVMEPVRGGRLARLTPEQQAPLRALRPQESPAAWAFRFVQSVPGILVTLSGMSNMDQLRENIGLYEEEKPLNQQEWDALQQVGKELLAQKSLPCTACHYCVSHCPQGLDIPMLLNLYNEHYFTGGGFIAPRAINSLPKEKQPSACIGCRSCEAVCPQQIKISQAMADFPRLLQKLEKDD